MVARVRTVAFHGVEVIEVETQVTIASGLPTFTVVGLPDKAVAESRERVRAALGALGLALPARRITVNLAPADVLKEGSHFDLPIALALLAAMDVLPTEELGFYMALGELALDGSRTSVAGVLYCLPHWRPRAEAAALSVPPGAAARPRGRARSRSSPRRTCWRSSTILRAPSCCPRRSRILLRRARRAPTCRMSRARRAPSARSRSPR